MYLAFHRYASDTYLHGALPNRVLQHRPFCSHQIVAQDEPSSYIEDPTRNMAQMVPKTSPALSPVERLPAEVVQNIATHLLGTYKGLPKDTAFVSDAGASSFDGLLEFRAASRTIWSKTEYIFNASFETAVIEYGATSLLRLWGLSNNKNLRSRVKSLVFVRPPVDAYIETPEDRQKLIAIFMAPGMNKATPDFDFITALITLALRRLRLHSIFIAPSLVTFHSERVIVPNGPLYPAPTVIVYAVLLSKVWLKRLEMGGGDWGTCQGIQPPETQIAACGRLGWSQVREITSISLVLSSCNCKLRPAHVQPMTHVLTTRRLLQTKWHRSNAARRMEPRASISQVRQSINRRVMAIPTSTRSLVADRDF